MTGIFPMGGPHIRATSAAGIAFLHGAEQCRLVAYRDVGHVWTIGWGTTRYPGGRKVAEGDTCSREQADAWFRYDLTRVETAVDALTVDTITQREFDALVSLVYNIGEPQYSTSTVRKRINLGASADLIRAAWMRFYKDNTDADPELEAVPGLWRRRHQEADVFLGVTTPLPPMPPDRRAA